MLSHEAIDESGLVTVRFSHPKDGGAETVAVVGEFNDWSPSDHPMTVDGDEHRCEIRLEPGRRHRFRYLIDGERWENDWQADAYAANDFGGEDSVVDLTAVVAVERAPVETAPPPPKRARGKKAAANAEQA